MKTAFLLVAIGCLGGSPLGLRSARGQSAQRFGDSQTTKALSSESRPAASARPGQHSGLATTPLPAGGVRRPGGAVGAIGQPSPSHTTGRATPRATSAVAAINGTEMRRKPWRP